MKTTELTGALLDYWVALAEGIPAAQLEISTHSHAVVQRQPRVERGITWRYSTDWAQGGPLIDKYQMGFGLYFESPDSYFALTGSNDLFGEGHGATHLIAACRAVVRAKFGDEVPDLTKGGA